MNQEHTYTPPRKKPSGKRSEPESTSGKHPGERPRPAEPERTDAEPSIAREDTSTPNVSDTRQQPVTNQDEQDKITNAEESNLPLADK